MATLALSLALFASVLSLGNLVISLYALVRILSTPPAPTQVVHSHLQSQEQGRAFFPGAPPREGLNDDLGMPDVYDPEEEEDAAAFASSLGI